MEQLLIQGIQQSCMFLDPRPLMELLLVQHDKGNLADLGEYQPQETNIVCQLMGHLLQK